MTYHNIGLIEIFLAASLVLINGVISFVWKLGLGKSLLMATVRTIVQLSLIGFVLKWIFQTAHIGLVFLMVMLMVVIAAHAASSRSSWKYIGMFLDTFMVIVLPSWLIVSVGLGWILQISPWYSPQYLIPMAGMVIGNVLTGVSLVLESLLSQLVQQRARIDSLLAMGATAWEAYQAPAAHAIKTGMMPTINSMMVVGIVSLPGMMTGQILAGQDPEQAVRYQIIVMFFLAAATGMACVLLVYMMFRRFFDANNTFLYGRLVKR